MEPIVPNETTGRWAIWHDHGEGFPSRAFAEQVIVAADRALFGTTALKGEFAATIEHEQTS